MSKTEFRTNADPRTNATLEHSPSKLGFLHISDNVIVLGFSQLVGAILVAGIDPTIDRQSRFAASLQARSNGRRQACGAMSWWIDFGPQPPWS